MSGYFLPQSPLDVKLHPQRGREEERRRKEGRSETGREKEKEKKE